MRIPNSGLRLNDPSWPLLQAGISYWGRTTAIGNILGTTLVDALCSTAGLQPSYAGLSIKLLDGNAAGAVRQIAIHALGTGIITVGDPWTDFNGALYQVPANTGFVILSAAGGGAPAPALAPSIGLWMFGELSPAQVASTTILLMPNLAGFPDAIFADEFWIQIIHNASAPGVAPSREIRRITNYVGATGTFTTDAFSANVEANDLVCVFHESIMSIEILGFGTLTVSSQTIPADGNRAGLYAWENNDYFKGCILMPTEGASRFQPRPIRGFTVAGGIFTLDEPLTALPGLVDYVIIGAAYPVQRLLDIFNIVNAILVTTETGGIFASQVAETNVYINNAPAGVWEPLVMKIDFTNQTAAETTVWRVYYRIVAAGGWVLFDELTFAGVQTPAGRRINLDPDRYGTRVSCSRPAGAQQNYTWETFVRT